MNKMATEDFFLFAYGSLLWDESDISTAGLPPFQLVAAPFMKTVLALTLALGRGGSREEDTSSAERVTAPSLRIVFLVARNLLAVRCYIEIAFDGSACRCERSLCCWSFVYRSAPRSVDVLSLCYAR